MQRSKVMIERLYLFCCSSRRVNKIAESNQIKNGQSRWLLLLEMSKLDVIIKLVGIMQKKT